MSAERYQSPVWDDVMRVWSDPVGVAEAGLRDGRSGADWWRVLVLYALMLAFSYTMHTRLGADKLWDRLLGPGASEPLDPSVEMFVQSGAFVWFACIMLFQWLALPRVSGWFGGSRSRHDSTLAYYLMFCVAFLPSFLTPVVDLAALFIQRLVPPMGSILMATAMVVILSAMFHQCTRVTGRVLGLHTYLRSFSVLIVSTGIGMLASLLLFMMIAVPIFVFMPSLLDITQ
ncbi:MAG: hypothetical protein FD175_944 [Beijerinckiaceae bacterium]|nr:MAG: hypothetical protein FD175_944 [Beijerinckiaceae bacterium]